MIQLPTRSGDLPVPISIVLHSPGGRFSLPAALQLNPVTLRLKVARKIYFFYPEEHEGQSFEWLDLHAMAIGLPTRSPGELLATTSVESCEPASR